MPEVMPEIVVLSVDDSDGFAYIIGRWLNDNPRIHHAAHIGSVAAMHEMVTLLRPRVVVLDMHAPGADPLDEMRRVLREHPEVRFVVMTSEAAEAGAALEAGAAEVVDKDYGRAQLAPAVLRVADAAVSTAEPKPRPCRCTIQSA